MLMLKRLIIHIVIQQKFFEKTPVNNVIVIFIRCEMENSIQGQKGSLLLKLRFQTRVIAVMVETRLCTFHFFFVIQKWNHLRKKNDLHFWIFSIEVLSSNCYQKKFLSQTVTPKVLIVCL